GPMIEAASPGASVKVTSESTGMGPRGVMYSLLRFETSSTDDSAARRVRWKSLDSGRGRRAPESVGVDLQQRIRRTRKGEVRANALGAALAEPARELPVGEQRVKAFSQAPAAVGRDEHAALRLLDDFGEGAAARLHDRHSAGHRL